MKLMIADMLGDPAHSCLRYMLRHDPRAVSPALVRQFVDVAIGTAQVAPAVDLQHELPEWRRTRAGRPQRRDIQQRAGPFQMGLMRHDAPVSWPGGTLRPTSQAASRSGSGLS